MASIAEIRQQYPQYDDMSDQQLADALHTKFYSDMPKKEYYSKIGMVQAQQPQEESYSGSILPISYDGKDWNYFDTDAGVIGAIKSALTLPGDVYSGKTDVNSDEAIERSLELAGTISPASAIGRAAKPATATLAQWKPKVPVPGADKLKSAAKEVYNEMNDAGLEYGMDSIDELARNIQDNLAAKKGIGDKLAPRTYGILRDLQKRPDGAVNVPFSTGLNSARKQLGRAGVRGDIINPEDPAAANFAARSIMDFMERPPKGSVVAGPPSERVAAKLKEANANYSAAKRSEMLTGIEDHADLQAAAANSGKNIGNNIRQRAVGLLKNKGSVRDRAGFGSDELQQIEKVAKGSLAANATRDIGNMLGGGGGLGGLVAGGAGYAVGGPAGVVGAGLVGRGAKAASNHLTKSALRKVDQATRKRSPLYEQQVAEAGLKKLTFDQRKALVNLVRTQLLAEMQGNMHYSMAD